MIDPLFTNINRLFVQSFKVGNNDPTRNYFAKYYMSLVEIKDFNVLIDNKPFFEQHIKDIQVGYGKLVQMARNDDYTTLIGTNSSKQANTSIIHKLIS